MLYQLLTTYINTNNVGTDNNILVNQFLLSAFKPNTREQKYYTFLKCQLVRGFGYI